VGISIGGIDLANEIVELHFQLRRTQKLLEVVINKTPNMAGILTQDDIKAADDDAFDFVRKKFPEMGIERKT